MKKFLVLLMAALISTMGISEVFARGSSGGFSGGRSSFSSSRSSGGWGSSSRSSSSSFSRSSSSSFGKSSSSTSSGSFWGSSKPSAPVTKPTTTWGSSTPNSNPAPVNLSTGRTQTPMKSSVDTATNQKMNISGTAGQTREQAIQNFTNTKAKTYNYNFDKEPITRPEYIPPSTRIGNVNYNINYDSGHHGYGYYDSSGGWIAYNVIRDATMLSMLAQRNQPQTVIITSPTLATTTANTGSSIGKTFLLVALAGCVVGFIIFLIRRAF